MDVRQLHAELRGIVQGPKRAQGWEALMGLLTPLYWERAETARREQVEEEVLPWLKAELERSWPAGLRIVAMDAPAPLKALGATLRVDLYPARLRSFMQARGHKSTGHLSKAALKVLPGLLWGEQAFEGVRIEQLERLHGAFVEALLEAAPDSLRHVRLRWFVGEADEARAAAEAVVALRGPALASYGALVGQGAAEGTQDGLYRPLIEGASALGALRHLELPPTARGQRDTTADLLREEGFVGLESVSFPYGLSQAHGALLMAREASRRLVRVGAGHLVQDLAMVQSHQEREAILAEADRLRCLWMGAPNLAGVQVWDLRSGEREDEGWETEDAARCEALRGAREERWGERLDAAVVDLSGLTAAQTRQVLWDGEGLRASERVEALRVGGLDEATLKLILERGHQAWPKLACLIIMRELSEAECARVRDSALLARLDVLDWAGLKHSPRMPGQALQLLGDAAQLKARERLVERAMDASLHPLFGYALLEQALLWGSLSKRHVARLARAMGMDEAPQGSMPNERVWALREHFFEVRGRCYAWMMRTAAAYGGEFKWPMEVM